jgi:hypothetical protein
MKNPKTKTGHKEKNEVPLIGSTSHTHRLLVTKIRFIHIIVGLLEHNHSITRKLVH